MSGFNLGVLARIPEQKHGESPEAYTIMVPGIGTDLPDEWDDFPCSNPKSWIHQATARTRKRTSVLLFDHKLRVEDLVSWDTILAKGDELLDAVRQHLKNEVSEDTGDVHLAFICHSLGGLILKSALVSARRRHDGNKTVLSLLSAIVFLGTPHIKQNDKSTWPNAIRILHIRAKKVHQELDNIASLECVASLSQQFEDTTLPIPILSAFETKTTRLKSCFKDNKLNHLLVSEPLAMTGLGEEKVIGIYADHSAICELKEGSVGRLKVLEFITKVFAKDLGERPGFLGWNKAVDRKDGTPWDDSDGEADNKNEPKAVPDSMAHLTSHPNLDLMQQREHTTAAVVQHSGPDTSAAANIQNDDLADTINSTASTTDVPQSSHESTDPHLPCMGLDAGVRVTDFSGREGIMKKLESALVHNEHIDDAGGLSTFALYGIGGIGKTSIAANFAWHCQQKKLFDVILWIRADASGKIRETFSKVAVQLRLQSEKYARDRHVSTRLVLDWLADPVKSFNKSTNLSKLRARWLIIYDNVDKHEILQKFWPISGYGSILMTSRDPVAADFMTEVLGVAKPDPEQDNVVALEPFNIEESRDFLMRLSGRKQSRDPAAAAKVAEVLDCIPLALRQMAGIMRYRDVTFEEFLKLYKDEHTHSDLFGERVRHNVDYRYNLSTVWGLHLLDKDATLLINVLSLLDPDHILEDTLRLAKQAGVTSFLDDEGTYTKARASLWHTSLIERKKEEKKLKIHRVVQATARTMMLPSQWCVSFKTACALLLAAWPKNKRVWNYTTDTWDACDEIVPNVMKLFGYYDNYKYDKEELANTQFIRLLIYSGWYYHDRGDSEEAKPFFHLANKLSGALGEDGHETMSEIHSSQGAIATETNDAEGCVHHYEELMKITEIRHGDMKSEEARINMAIALNELGIARMMSDDINNGRRNFERSKSLALDHITSPDPRALRFYCLSSANLGMTHWMRKHSPQAKEILEQALLQCERQKLDEDDSFIYGRLYHALGNVYWSLEDYDKALEWHQKAFDHYEKTIRIDHHRTADVAVRIADYYRKHQDWNSASSHLRTAEKVFEAKSCFKPEMSRLLHKRALLLSAQGNDKEADDAEHEACSLYKEVYSTRHQAQPPDHPHPEDYDNIVTFWSR